MTPPTSGDDANDDRTQECPNCHLLRDEADHARWMLQ
jgi:hypothetical protein